MGTKPSVIAETEPGAERLADPASSDSGGGSRPMRADAARNRLRILEAAEEAFAREGISLPIDTVAKRAGVGAGTLYRHFPTKEALFEAIVMHRLDQLSELAESYSQADDAGQALFSFLRQFATQAAAKKDLLDAIGAEGIDIKATCAAKLDDLIVSIDALLRRAVSCGAVRSDVTVEELVGLVVGACHGTGQMPPDEARIQKMVGIVCDGIRSFDHETAAAPS